MADASRLSRLRNSRLQLTPGQRPRMEGEIYQVTNRQQDPLIPQQEQPIASPVDGHSGDGKPIGTALPILTARSPN